MQETEAVKESTLERMILTPFKYTAATMMGIGYVVVESPLAQYFRKRFRPDMDNPDLGNTRQRFKFGYDATLNTFEYMAPDQGLKWFFRITLSCF